MKKQTLLLLISVYSVPTIAAMVSVVGKKYTHRSFRSGNTYLYSSQKKILVPTPEPSSPYTLCVLLEQGIFTLPTLCYTYHSPGALYQANEKTIRDAAFLVNSLAQTNRFLNKFINDKERTLDLIKKLSHCFCSNDLSIARRLCTKSSKKRFRLQKSFLDGCITSNLDKYYANLFKEKGVDVNFSSARFKSFPLLEVLFNNNMNAVKWLIENGADIAVRTTWQPAETTAYMLVLATHDWALTQKVLEDPVFNVHHKNKNGDTPLHYCFFRFHSICYGFQPSPKKGLTRSMYMVIEQLLEKGADPMAVNNQGFAPFDWAKESGDENLIAWMDYYASDFNSQKNADSVC